MRRRLAGLLVLLMVAPAAGQVVVLEDEADDAQASAAGQADLPAGTWDATPMDLISFSIAEHPQAFDFILKVPTLEREVEPEGDTAYYFVDFQHADVGFRLQYIRQVLGGGVSYGAQVQAYDSGRQQYVPILFDTDLDVRPGEGIMTLTAPRDLFIDGNGTAPTLGREFTLFRAFTRSTLLGADGISPIRVDDAMPDSGFSDIPYEVQQGLKQTGHAFLESANPVRASNGEEATFLYYVTAHNMEPDDDRFTLDARGVPQGWTVTLPAASIRIDGNGSQVFPVLVSTPFNHEHGAFESFVLTMESQRDSSALGQLQVGIRYLEIPQPAGHHDRIWIHARADTSPGGLFSEVLDGAGAVAYMNAMENDERSQDLAVPPDQFGCCGPSTTFGWEVFLEPGLALGLDFDLNRTGDLSVEFTSDVPMSDAILSGALVHVDADGLESILGDLAQTSPQQLSGAVRFDTVFTPKHGADLVLYQPGSALRLDLNLQAQDAATGSITSETAPKLLPTGELTLPLFEYRDPVEDVFNTLAGLSLVHADRKEKYVNPGETVLLNLTLTNEGAVDDVFTLRVNGTNQDWSRLLGDTKVFVPTGASRSIVVAITPDDAALDGDVVDLIVTAASDAEPAVQANARVVAIVDDLLDRPDEAYLISDVEKQLTDKDKDSPALPLVALLLLVAVVVRLRRR